MPKSSSKFEHIFLYYLHEDMVTSNTVGGSAGGFDPDGNINSSDSYAPGDARNPKVLGGIQRRGDLSTETETETETEKRKKKKKKVKRLRGVNKKTTALIAKHDDKE